MNDEFLGVGKQNADNKLDIFLSSEKCLIIAGTPFLQRSVDIGKNGQKGVDLMKQEGTIQTRR